MLLSTLIKKKKKSENFIWLLTKMSQFDTAKNKFMGNDVTLLAKIISL